MKLRKTLASVGAATAVMAGSVLVAIPAMAQDEDPTDDATVEEEHRHRAGSKFTAVADALGIDLDQLRGRLQDDETIADIATAEGVAVDDVIDAIMGQAEERLADAVADERLTQEEADERLVDIEERVTDFVNGEVEFGRRGFGGPRGFGPGLEAAADLLGLQAADIAHQLEDGANLAEIANEQGVSVDELTAAMVAPAADHLGEHVADGDMSQEEADERLADITERIEGVVNGDTELGGHRFGDRGHGPRGGGFGGPGPNAAESATTNT